MERLLEDIEGVFGRDANTVIHNLEINNYNLTNHGEVNINSNNQVTFTMNVVINNNNCCQSQIQEEEYDEYYEEEERLYRQARELDRQFVTRFW